MYSVCIAKYPKGFPFTKAYKSVWSVIYFEPVGADKTRVSIRMLGYTDDEELQKNARVLGARQSAHAGSAGSEVSAS